MTSGNTAVALICDRNFLAPTIGTAIRARSYVDDPNVRFFVYLTGSRHGDDDLELVERLGETVSEAGIDLRYEPLDDLSDIDAETYNKTHVPVTTMARMWLDYLLPADVTNFLYLDGDVDITGALDPLLNLKPPEGGFLAAPDLPLLIENDMGNAARKTLAYLDNLGVKRGADYFNCGVMLIDRSGWGDLSREALEFFAGNSTICQYHDQSALNAVAGGRRGRLSLYWNYQTDFMMVMDPREWGIQPRIWHFTKVPKPWHRAAFPWPAEFGTSGRAGYEIFARAGVPLPTDPAPDCINRQILYREKLRQRFRFVYPWRRRFRTQRILADLKGTADQIPGATDMATAAVPDLANV